MKKILIAFISLIFASSLLAYTHEISKFDLMLEFNQKLNLSPNQVKKIKELRLELKKYKINQKAKMEVCKLELNELLHVKEKNLKSIRDKYYALAELQAEINFSDVKSEVDAYKTLSTEQKEQFGVLLEKWHADKMKHAKIKDHNVFLFDDDKMWVDCKSDEEDVYKTIEHKGDHGETEIYKIRRKVHKGEEGEIDVEVEVTSEDTLEEVSEAEGEDVKHKVIKIRKIGKEGEDIHEVIKILKESDLKEILETHGDQNIIIIKKKDGRIEVIHKNEEGESHHKVKIKKDHVEQEKKVVKEIKKEKK